MNIFNHYFDGALRVTLKTSFLLFSRSWATFVAFCVFFLCFVWAMVIFFSEELVAWWCLRCCCRISSDYPHIERAISKNKHCYTITLLQRYTIWATYNKLQDKCRIHAQQRHKHTRQTNKLCIAVHSFEHISLIYTLHLVWYVFFIIIILIWFPTSPFSLIFSHCFIEINVITCL